MGGRGKSWLTAGCGPSASGAPEPRLTMPRTSDNLAAGMRQMREGVERIKQNKTNGKLRNGRGENKWRVGRGRNAMERKRPDQG